MLTRSSTRPSTCSRARVVGVPDVVGAEPAQPVVVDAERRGGEVGAAEVAVGQGRAPEVDASLVVEGDLGAGQRCPVVDASAGGLAHAVGRDHPHAGPLGAGAQPRCEGGAPDEHRVEGAQRLRAARVVEQPDELGGHEAGVAGQPGVEQGGGGEERRREEAVGEVHGDRGGPGIQRAQQHLQARDVVRRQREQPLARAAEPLVRGAAAGPQGAGGEQGALGGAGRPRRADDDGEPVGQVGRVVRAAPGGGADAAYGSTGASPASAAARRGRTLRDAGPSGTASGSWRRCGIGISGCGRASRPGPGRAGRAPAARRGARWVGRAPGRRPSTRRRSPRTSPRRARSSG